MLMGFSWAMLVSERVHQQTFVSQKKKHVSQNGPAPASRSITYLTYLFAFHVNFHTIRVVERLE